ncbi:mCG147269, partial [Mus musculus]
MPKLKTFKDKKEHLSITPASRVRRKRALIRSDRNGASWVFLSPSLRICGRPTHGCHLGKLDSNKTEW